MSAQLEYVQDSRFLKIDTDLGENALLLTSLHGMDSVSKPFLYEIAFGTRLADEQILTLIGKPATIWFCNTANVTPRPVNGVIRKLSGPSSYPQGFTAWRAELVPQLSFLAYTRNCRIYQNKTVVQIVTDMLNQYGIRKFEFRSLMGKYPTLDYCVQYRESALNFVSRMLEHFGIYYWFEHTGTAHTLVMADATRVAKPSSPHTLLMPDQDQNAPVRSLEANYAFRPGTWTLKDYDFTKPDSPLKSSTPTMITDAPMASYEIFEYPGTYAESSHGDNLSRVRIEQEEAQFHRLRGTGTLPLLDAGTIATIALPEGATGHTEQKFFLTQVSHSASDMSHIAMGASPAQYDNSFVVVPLKYGFRPERSAGKPFVQGPQTARVTGPAGQKIYTDKHARVKVRFHWDRNPDGNTDDQSSCWVRVSQSWASGMGGSIHIPRVGEEVIVDFLEGDPDQPIITGRVYNGNNMTQYGLPANQTQSGFKTQSIPSGGSNEFRFEDKAGSEEIYVHSQKDFNRKIEHNETDTIGVNATRKIGSDLATSVGGKENRDVTGNVTRTTGGDEAVSVKGKDTIKIGGDCEIVLGAKYTHSTTSDETRMVGGNRKASISGTAEEDISQTLKIIAGSDITVSSNTSISITAATKITLGVGGSTIEITASGITATASGQILMTAAIIEHNT